ncbi:hypothetical protein [Arthrobacter sp. M4]|uniref:hypothetical protein n=1 Tax=Arthrobacter sp. M4 TaxID=218160 RepID=UPI001CDD050B|nr:hypothetical protein [Arthrobacter sp. M4]MCA4135533.1 hypothetical protein [Arthrobacter sp. M4]
MELDFTALETGTYVFIGTLFFALVLALFLTVAAFVAMVLISALGGAWYVLKTVVVGLVHSINAGWDRLVHHVGQVELPVDFQPEPAPTTASYPRVALRDS